MARVSCASQWFPVVSVRRSFSERMDGTLRFTNRDSWSCVPDLWIGLSTIATRCRPFNFAARRLANHSAAGADAKAFRGINGRLPTAVSLWWVPSIYSTVPRLSRPDAALWVSHGDRRMRGRVHTCADSMIEGRTPNPAPSEIGAVFLGAQTTRLFWITGQALRPRSMKHLLRLFAVWIQSPGAIWQSLSICRLPFNSGLSRGPKGREEQWIGSVKHEVTGGWYVAARCA
jgi:hypothetical protein